MLCNTLRETVLFWKEGGNYWCSPCSGVCHPLWLRGAGHPTGTLPSACRGCLIQLGFWCRMFWDNPMCVKYIWEHGATGSIVSLWEQS